MKTVTQQLIKLVAVAALGLMPSSGFASGATELNELGPDRAFPRVARSYQSMDATYSRTGFNRSAAQVARIKIGSSQDQVVAAVGQPVSAYRDGSWNFNIAFPLPQGNRLICQYRVYFDSDETVAGTLWRRPQCADIATGRSK